MLKNQINAQDKRKSVQNDYDTVAEDYAVDFGTELEDTDILDEFLVRLKPNSKILDCGGGTGKLTDFLIKHGHQAICYDFSKSMMKKAKELFPKIPYILDDIVSMKKHFQNGSFDGIAAFYSLFHIPKEEIDTVFASISDLLTDDGLFVFVTQLGNGEDWIDEPYLKEKGKKVLYVNWLTKPQVCSLLEKNHFKIVCATEKNEIATNELGQNDQNNKFCVVAQKHSSE